MTNLLDIILEEIYTQTESLRRLRLLKEHLAKKIFNQSSLPASSKELPTKAAGKNQASPPISEMAFKGDLSISLQLANEDQIWLEKTAAAIAPFVNKNTLYNTFSDLEKTIKNIEVLTLFLPFEMPLDEIKKLGVYLRRDYGKNFLMELRLDPKLIAGCALSWKGVYKDYSLHQRMMASQAAILDTLKKSIKHQQNAS